MALRVAVATGNWSNPAIWNAGVLPVAGDVVASNGFTVTIDQNVNVDLLSNAVQSPVIITANMTSNTTPSGIVSASSQFSTSHLPWQAFQYINTADWLSAIGSVGWIAYEFPTPKVVAKYTILRSVNNQFPTSTPRDWTLEAWTGTDWIILDTVTGNTGDYTADVPNTTSYIQYRVNITANNGGSYIGIREIFFYEANDYGANSVAGGGFILNDSYTVTGNLVGSSGTLLTYTGSTSASIVGDVFVTNAGATIVFNSVSGTLNITGDIRRSNGLGGRGLDITNTGVVNVVGNLNTIGSSFPTTTILITANCTLNFTGNLSYTLSNVQTGNGLIFVNFRSTINFVGTIESLPTTVADVANIRINTTDCIVNVTGTVRGGTNAIRMSVRSRLTIIGSIICTSNTQGSTVISTSTDAINLFTGPFICSEYGYFPYAVVRMHLIPTAASYIEFRDETTGGASTPVPPAPPTQLISPSTLVSNLAIADVRFGTVYAMGTLTGTLRMPTPNQVTFGVAVDDTFGNSVLTAASVWDYLVSNITVEGSIGMRLKNVATPQTIGEQLEAFLRLD